MFDLDLVNVVLSDKTPKEFYRAQVVWAKQNLPPETGQIWGHLHFYKMKDGNIHVTVRNRPLKQTMVALVSHFFIELKGGTVKDRMHTLRYMRRHWPEAIKLP